MCRAAPGRFLPITITNLTASKTLICKNNSTELKRRKRFFTGKWIVEIKCTALAACYSTTTSATKACSIAARWRAWASRSTPTKPNTSASISMVSAMALVYFRYQMAAHTRVAGEITGCMGRASWCCETTKLTNCSQTMVTVSSLSSAASHAMQHLRWSRDLAIRLTSRAPLCRRSWILKTIHWNRQSIARSSCMKTWHAWRRRQTNRLAWHYTMRPHQ